MFAKLINLINHQKNQKLFLFIFLVAWLIINLVQSYFTNLAHDEAYYWMYSRNLDWGYFDHPPMIALLIKAGYSLFQNEMGIRLCNTILGTLTLLIIFHLIEAPKKSLWLYLALVCSVILIQSHVGGFLAIPDIPVVFFSALFLFLYKKYLKQDKVSLAILLSIAGACMLYSKYHGVLILFFTFFANIKIARRKSFWIIPALIAMFMLPHLFWQIRNNFPTLEYHLVTRSSVYKFDHTINFLYSQILIAGPLVAVIILFKAFTFRTSSVFERILKVNLAGIFFFFFLSSFKGHVEAHWTAIAFIPLLVLSYNGISRSSVALKWINWLLIPSILLFILIRISLIVEILPKTIQPVREVFDWQEWANELDSIAGNRQVVFVNSFQRPSKYTYYTGGKFATSLNNIYYRKNQFDLWPFEDSVQHKRVLLVNSRTPEDTLYSSVGEVYQYELIDDFVSYCDLKIALPFKKVNSLGGENLQFTIQLINSRTEPVLFTRGDEISATYHNGGSFSVTKSLYSLENIKVASGDSLSIPLTLEAPQKKGKYSLYLSIRTLNQFPALNSPVIHVSVK